MTDSTQPQALGLRLRPSGWEATISPVFVRTGRPDVKCMHGNDHSANMCWYDMGRLSAAHRNDCKMERCRNKGRGPLWAASHHHKVASLKCPLYDFFLFTASRTLVSAMIPC